MHICTDVRLSMQTNNTWARGRAQWTSIAESVYARNQQCMRNDVRSGCFASTISLFGLASHQVAIAVALFRYQEAIYKGRMVGSLFNDLHQYGKSCHLRWSKRSFVLWKAEGQLVFIFTEKLVRVGVSHWARRRVAPAYTAVARNSLRGRGSTVLYVCSCVHIYTCKI